MSTEIWLPIPGFDGYEASSEGRIRSLTRTITYLREGKEVVTPKTGTILTTSNKVNNSGYQFAAIAPKRGTVSVHHLIAITFIGPKPSTSHCVNHKDCNKQNNKASNLEWVTYSENLKHAVGMGRFDVFKKEQSIRSRGENNHNSKLTAEKVLAIRADESTHEVIAAKYGITKTHVWFVKNKKVWKHI